MGELIGVAEILTSLMGVVVAFVYRTIVKQTQDVKDELTSKIEKIEQVLSDDIAAVKEELTVRVNKFEENSRRDDETVKELIKDSEGRMREEITARIRNIVELHGKIEKAYETLTSKHESVLDRISKIEGIVQGKEYK
jgi:hypothetical protein